MYLVSVVVVHNMVHAHCTHKRKYGINGRNTEERNLLSSFSFLFLSHLLTFVSLVVCFFKHPWVSRLAETEESLNFLLNFSFYFFPLWSHFLSEHVSRHNTESRRMSREWMDGVGVVLSWKLSAYSTIRTTRGNERIVKATKLTRVNFAVLEFSPEKVSSFLTYWTLLTKQHRKWMDKKAYSNKEGVKRMNAFTSQGSASATTYSYVICMALWWAKT